MITKTVGYSVGGSIYVTLEDAQKAELDAVVKEHFDIEGKMVTTFGIACAIINNKAQILDILTTKENSKVKARKINGGKKERKAAAVNAALQDSKQ